MLRNIQIIQIAEFVYFDSIKIFVLIISGKISGKFSGNLPTEMFTQLSDAIFDKRKLFFWQL